MCNKSGEIQGKRKSSFFSLLFSLAIFVKEVTRNHISKKINPDFKSILNFLLLQDLLKESQEIYKSHPPRDKTLINHSNSPGKIYFYSSPPQPARRGNISEEKKYQTNRDIKTYL